MRYSWKENKVEVQMNSNSSGVYQIGVDIGYINEYTYLHKQRKKILDSFKPTVLNLLKLSKFPSRFYIIGQKIEGIDWQYYVAQSIEYMYNMDTDTSYIKSGLNPAESWNVDNLIGKGKNAFLLKGLKLLHERMQITKIVETEKNLEKLVLLLEALNDDGRRCDRFSFISYPPKVNKPVFTCMFCNHTIKLKSGFPDDLRLSSVNVNDTLRYITCYNSLGARLSLGKLPFNLSIYSEKYGDQYFTLTKIFNPFKLLVHPECLKVFSLLPDYDILLKCFYDAILPPFKVKE